MRCVQEDKEDDIMNGGILCSREDELLSMYVSNNITTKYKRQRVIVLMESCIKTNKQTNKVKTREMSLGKGTGSTPDT